MVGGRCEAPHRKIFMVHIPKTAGSTINHLMAKCLGVDQVLTHIEGRLGALTALKSPPPNILFASGHHRLPDVIDAVERSQWFVFLNLRNPVEHLISHLKHLKALGNPQDEARRNRYTSEIQQMALRLWEIDLNHIDKLHRFINEEFSDAPQLFDNCQTRYLISHRTGAVCQSDAEEALRALKTVEFVGLTEFLAESLSVIEKTLGIMIDYSSNCRINQSLISESVNLSDPAILLYYREAVKWDAALYVAAKKRA